MTRDTFNAMLRWTPDDEQSAGDGGWPPDRHRPAPWPDIMLAQRLAWRDGAAETYLALYGPKARAA